MATNLLLPGGTRPTNLHLIPWQLDEHGLPIITSAKLVTSDMFMICERVREVSDRLYLIELERTSVEGQRFGYSVMEHCPDMDRLVMRVTKDGLNASVLEKLRYMMALPLDERIAKCERERESWEHDQAEAAAEEAWETIGGPMWGQLEHDGFIEQRPVSYRKLNRQARRAMQHSGRRSVMGLPTSSLFPRGVEA